MNDYSPTRYANSNGAIFDLEGIHVDPYHGVVVTISHEGTRSTLKADVFMVNFRAIPPEPTSENRSLW